jgi:hypothetical protein
MQVVAFFDPKDETVTTPPENVPARSWKMNDETKRWVLAGHDALNQAGLTKQIEAARCRNSRSRIGKAEDWSASHRTRYRGFPGILNSGDECELSGQ